MPVGDDRTPRATKHVTGRARRKRKREQEERERQEQVEETGKMGLEERLTSATQVPVKSESRLECVICLRGDSEVKGWVVLKPCQHVCVCQECSEGLVKIGDPCPKCRKTISGCDQVFL